MDIEEFIKKIKKMDIRLKIYDDRHDIKSIFLRFENKEAMRAWGSAQFKKTNGVWKLVKGYIEEYVGGQTISEKGINDPESFLDYIKERL